MPFSAFNVEVAERIYRLVSSQYSLPMSQEALQSAMKLHQAGDLDQAEAIYRQLLARNPADSDALNLMGVVLSPPAGMDLAIFSGELGDFADIAALVQNLDLVVTVDTSIAHLAGALAKPVWVLIPFVCDFRWLRKRTDSPWYPTMRLFREPVAGDWATPVAQMVQALREFQR